MANFPALPASVDRYVREIINRMLGRTGNVGDRVVLQEDLVALGLATEKGQKLSQPATGIISITDSLEPAVTPVEGVVPPDNPTPASGLSANGIFGAVILEWDAPAYNGHNHTEVWRAQVDDQSQASLIHEANGSRYTDVTGNTTLHYYWVRYINNAGQAGSFNLLSGTWGQGSAIINLADLMLESPELSEQPFSVKNIGTDAEPEYVLVFNGYLAVNGPVNISQLKSGELQEGTALTVGRGSIELSTGSDGYGQMVITGSGGIAANDYLVIKEGRIESFVYTESAGHVRYKEVRRTESGVAKNGQQVTIPAYFKSQPTVNLYPRDITVYNADYPAQSQRLEMDHSIPLPHPDTEGAWLFTPYARLILADGTKTDASGKTYFGSTNSKRWAVYNTDNTKQVTVSCRAASSRSTGGGNIYQNRKVTLALEYRPDGSDWISGGYTTLDINQFDTHILQVTKDLPQANYDIAVSLTTEDRDGTFTSGAIEYEYSQQGKLGTAMDITFSPENNAYDETYDITINNYALSGWEITRIEYTATVDIKIEVQNVFRSSSSIGSNEVIKGKVRVKLPDSSGGYQTYEETTTHDSVDWNDDYNIRRVEHKDIYLSWNDTTYLDGKFHPPVDVWCERAGYRFTGSNPPYEPSSLANIYVRSIKATVYYRRPKPASTTPSNTFYWDSTSYDLGATDVSLTDAIIHWTATGE